VIVDIAARYLRLLRLIRFSVWVTLLLAELTRLPLGSKRLSGLSGMRECFEQLGGSIQIRPQNGTGFALSAWFPLSLGEANS
jgi:hypothetical protein